MKNNPGLAISDAEKLKKFCLKNLEKSHLLRKTNFLEKACSLSMKQVIAKKNENIEVKNNEDDYLQGNQKIKLTDAGKRIMLKAKRKQFSSVVKETMDWCNTNLSKIYSQETKTMENYLTQICFKKSPQK